MIPAGSQPCAVSKRRTPQWSARRNQGLEIDWQSVQFVGAGTKREQQENDLFPARRVRRLPSSVIVVGWRVVGTCATGGGRSGRSWVWLSWASGRPCCALAQVGVDPSTAANIGISSTIGLDSRHVPADQQCRAADPGFLLRPHVHRDRLGHQHGHDRVLRPTGSRPCWAPLVPSEPTRLVQTVMFLVGSRCSPPVRRCT